MNVTNHVWKTIAIALAIGIPASFHGQASGQILNEEANPVVEAQGNPDAPKKKQGPEDQIYVVLDAPELSGEKRKAWKKVCGIRNKKSVGFKKLLSSGNTRWGDGVVCLNTPKKLPKIIKSHHGTIVLTLKWTDPHLDFILELRAGKKILPLNTYRMGLEDNPLKELSSEKTLELISQMLAEASSFGWLAPAKELEPTSLGFTLTERQGSLKLPEYLYAYQLEIQSTPQDSALPSLKPTIFARLKRTEKKSLNADKNIEVKYSVSESYQPLTPGTIYHLHTELGPGSRQAAFDTKIKAAVKGSSLLGFVDDLIFGTISSNAGGIRIGKSLMLDSLLKKTFLVSALVEIRGGPFQGLRWYYDIIPEVKSTARGTPESFRLARASLGWSFDIPMPNPISDYIKIIDFQPKVGLLDIKTNLAVESGINADKPLYTSLNFEARNVMDFAGELGFEQQTPWFRARLWTSLNGAAFGLSNKDAVKVFSSRTGLDLYHDLVGFNLPFSAGVLGFVMFENLNLSKDPTKVQTISGPGLSSIAFSTFFLGGGLTLSW